MSLLDYSQRIFSGFFGGLGGAIGGALSGVTVGLLLGAAYVTAIEPIDETEVIRGFANFCALGGVIIGLIYGFRSAYQEEKTRIEEKAERERQEQREIAERKKREIQAQEEATKKAKLEIELARKNKEEIERQEKNLASMLAASKERYLSAQRLVTEAENQLGYSDLDFRERAFAPYWDRIEFVATSLAKYRNEIDSIKQTAINYNNQASKITSGVPAFVLPSQTQPDAEAIVQRLQSSVRKAQTDFQFASIFEQRRTNKLLADGFGTLAETINTIGQTMRSSLSGLSHTLQASLDEHSRVSQSQHEEQLAQQIKLKSVIIDGLDRQERTLEDIRDMKAAQDKGPGSRSFPGK